MEGPWELPILVLLHNLYFLQLPPKSEMAWEHLKLPLLKEGNLMALSPWGQPWQDPLPVLGLLHSAIDGLTHMVGSMAPPPPPTLSVDTAIKLLRLRTQMDAIQQAQGVLAVSTSSRSREHHCRRSRVNFPSPRDDTARALAFSRLGPLCRIDGVGRIHFEPWHETNTQDVQTEATLAPTFIP